MPLLHHCWCPGDGTATLDDPRWLRARIASVLIDWPGVALEEIACTSGSVRLTVRARDAAAAQDFVAAVEAEVGVAVQRRTANSEQRTAKRAVGCCDLLPALGRSPSGGASEAAALGTSTESDRV